MSRALLSSLLVVIAAGTWTAECRADPQGNVGLTVGVAGRAYHERVWDRTVFHLGLRGDVLFARDGDSDFGVGPYAEMFTHAFDELQVGHGISLLVPVIDTFPIVFSAGNYLKVRDDRFPAELGVAGSIFAGTRGYNFSAGYSIAAGLLLQGRVGLGDSRETSIILSAQLDAAFLGMPFVYLIDAIDGGSREADEVPRD